MSANVDKMFSVREMPWWIGTSEDKGQADILGEHPSWDDARQLAGLDWDPAESPLLVPVANYDLRAEFSKIVTGSDPTADQIEALIAAHAAATRTVDGWKHIGRDDDPTATLSCTMDSYSTVANSAFGQIFESVLGQPNVKFETGGCLAGGRKVWMLCVLDEPMSLPGDKSVTMPYLALQSRHDARGATTLRATAVRIVCANTFHAAEMGGDDSAYDVRGAGATYSFIHRGDTTTDSATWQKRLEDAREAVTGARREMRDYAEAMTRLLGIKINAKQTDRFLHSFIPAPPDGITSDRVKHNIEEARAAVRTLIDGQTVEGAGVKGTAYGLVQAAGEYLDHVRRSQSWETKLRRTLLRPEPLKAQAIKLALEAANA